MFRRIKSHACSSPVIKTLGAMLFSVLLVACDAGIPQAPKPGAASVLGTNDVIAILDRSQQLGALKSAATAQGYRFVRTTPLPALGKVMVTFEKPDSVTGAQAIAYLEAAEPASVVGINHAYRLQANTQPIDPRNYAQALIEWPAGGCSALVPVGLIDTRVDTSAPGVANARVVSRHFGRGDAFAGRHGTEVASVLADPRRLKGVTIYNASVMSRTENGELLAGADALIQSLDWLAGQNVRIVNISLAGPFNKILEVAVDEAAARGLILVASVGNYGSNAGPFYPAAFGPVIATTAVDANASIYNRAVQGSFVDIAAPGVDIFVPSNTGGRFVTGTSFAAPFVTARIAADPRFFPARSAERIRQLLAQESRDLGPEGTDATFGTGLLKGPASC